MKVIFLLVDKEKDFFRIDTKVKKYEKKRKTLKKFDFTIVITVIYITTFVLFTILYNFLGRVDEFLLIGKRQDQKLEQH